MNPRQLTLGVVLGLVAVTVSLGVPGWVRPRVPSPHQQEGATDEGRGLRERTQPGTWKRGVVRPFRTVFDRQKKRAEAIEGRAERSAYDGAPPVMPHSAIFGDGSKTCLDCHLEGMTMGARVAHPMSHPPFASCLQCHVEASNRQFTPRSEVVTSFVGRPSPGPGPRMTAESPPQIPHHVVMRGQCLACHGEFGYVGLRTTHPERANCVQCHVSSTATMR